MTPESIAEAVEAERAYAASQVFRGGDRLSALPRLHVLLDQLSALSGARDVEQVNISQDYARSSAPLLDFYLRKKDSTFPRDVVRLLRISLAKSPSEEGIVCKGVYEGVTLRIQGYLPDSCAVVYETVEVPAHMEKRAKVVCAKPVEEVNGDAD